MANKAKREKFNLSLSPEVLLELRQIAHENTIKGRYTAVSDLAEEAILRWLGRDKGHDARPMIAGPTSERPADSRTVPHQGLIDKLLYVLDSDSKDAIDAVRTNIEVFFRLVRVDDKKAGRKRTPPKSTEDPDSGEKLTG